MSFRGFFRHAFFISCLSALGFLQAGCSLIFGGSQAVDNKSHDYTTLRLDKAMDKNWKKLPAKTATDGSDLAYEHGDTGAIISLNSVCGDTSDESLQELSKTLLMGLDEQSRPRTRQYQVDGVDAIESTVDVSTTDGKTARIRAVVLKKQRCTYDIMYVAPLLAFETDVGAFNKFLKGFHVE